MSGALLPTPVAVAVLVLASVMILVGVTMLGREIWRLLAAVIEGRA